MISLRWRSHRRNHYADHVADRFGARTFGNHRTVDGERRRESRNGGRRETFNALHASHPHSSERPSQTIPTSTREAFVASQARQSREATRYYLTASANGQLDSRARAGWRFRTVWSGNGTSGSRQRASQFWRDGYEATSLENLLATTGLSKSSLYGTFGSKHAFLMACLDRYVDTVPRGNIADLRRGPPAAAIARSYEKVLGLSASSKLCFLQVCATELAWRDQPVRSRVRRGFENSPAGLL
jgi:hypothetical protein